MKFSCIQENLKQGLTMVSNITSKNINLPILNNVLIEVKDNSIHLSSTNLEIGIKNTIRGKVEQEGSFTVEAKLLNDYISLLPKERIDLELKENQLLVSCNNNKTKIKGINASDFPLIPELKKENSFICNAEKLRQGLSQVMFAAAKNESRPEICGVYMNFKNKILTITATDSYRLAERQMSLENSSSNEEQTVIVPLRTLQEVVRILSNYRDNIENPENISMYISEGQVLFEYDVVEIVSRLIEGQYPDYKQIIPDHHETTAIVSINDLVKAVKTASLFSKTGINDINMEIEPPKEGNNALSGNIKVTSMNDQVGENLSLVNANITGLKNGIVLNYSYFLDGLSNLLSNEAKIKMIDSSSPCVLETADLEKEDKNERYLYIIMPIRQ